MNLLATIAELADGFALFPAGSVEFAGAGILLSRSEWLRFSEGLLCVPTSVPESQNQ